MLQLRAQGSKGFDIARMDDGRVLCGVRPNELLLHQTARDCAVAESQGMAQLVGGHADEII